MRENYKIILASIALAVIPTLLIWVPYFFRFEKFWNIPLTRDGMATIVANFDGPLYIAVAKTLYDPQELSENYQFPLSNEYYSAHFPLYPLLIKSLSWALGYPYSMLTVTIITSAVAIYFFHKHALLYLKPNNAYWLTFVFSIFPARWLIVRSVGSPEPLFVATILASTYFFAKGRYLWAGIFGALAQMTKSPGVLLFVAYAMQIFIPSLTHLVHTNFKKFFSSLNLAKVYPLLLIPLGLLAVFGLYYFRYGDFFTYFKSGDNIHLFFRPFQVFDYSAPWVGTFWLEEIIFFYLIGFIGIWKLYSQKMYTYFYFSLVFFTSLLFVSHRDILRYAIPLLPFLIIGYKDVIFTKEFKYAIILLIIPVYLYSLAFISQNAMPISNWGPFL